MKIMIIRGRTAVFAVAALMTAVVIACLFGILPQSLQAAAATKYRLIRSVETEEKVLAITADGRENSWYIEEFDSYLHRYDIKASFFITGSYAREYSRVLDSLRADGHTIQSLGSKGADLSKMTVSQLVEDLDTAAEMIKKYAWHPPTVVRCMDGDMKRDAISAAIGKGYHMVSASIDSAAYPGLEGTTLGEKMAEYLQPGAIVRFRMDVSGDAAAMDRFISSALEQGYRVIPLEDLLLDGDYAVDGNGMQYQQ